MVVKKPKPTSVRTNIKIENHQVDELTYLAIRVGKLQLTTNKAKLTVQ